MLDKCDFTPAYLLYVGEGGWSVRDTAYLIDKNGNAKILKESVRSGVLPPELTLAYGEIDLIINNDIINNFSTEAISLDKKTFTKIKKTPSRCCGMDGFRVCLYAVKDSHLAKVWDVEDYGQIKVLDELQDKFISTGGN